MQHCRRKIDDKVSRTGYEDWRLFCGCAEVVEDEIPEAFGNDREHEIPNSMSPDVKQSSVYRETCCYENPRQQHSSASAPRSTNKSRTEYNLSKWEEKL